jgi:ABC-type nitrate/sulfonate/bicarbonate transport system ATPase subunit
MQRCLPAAIRASSPAGSGSGWAWRGRWRPSPGILLMDEPFGALDPLTRGEMQDMLRGLMGEFKKTVLLVTHDLDEALYLADRIVLLGEGG